MVMSTPSVFERKCPFYSKFVLKNQNVYLKVFVEAKIWNLQPFSQYFETF